MRKKLIIIFSILVFILLGAYLFKQSIANSGLPDYNEAVNLKGLKEEVTVYRDEFGIPHIIAKNEADLYKVTGYIIAQDRMWQMDLVRRLTQGRLSEIFGDKAIGTDKLFRALQISKKSTSVLKKTDKEITAALKHFSDGVNQYIQQDDLSFEFKVLNYKPDLWKPEHSVNFIGYMAWTLTQAWKSEIAMFKIRKNVSEEVFSELMVDLNFQKDVVFPKFKDSLILSKNLLDEYAKVEDMIPEVFSGSNNWAVSGKKSTTGKPLFANDMHLGFNIPGVWSQIHQQIEGKLDVTGVILPGQPFVVAGHNKKIAWGMTNVGVDTMDFYIETVNKDTTQYEFNGEWRDLIIQKEIIKIKDGENIEKIIRYTHRGPIVSGFKKTNQVISVHWTGNEPSNEVSALYNLNRAQNWKEFRKACSSFKSVSQNIAYADIDGNIGLQCSSGIPIRAADGNNIFPGNTDKYDWKGMYNFEKLPFIYNPECGYIHSANNRTTAIDSFYVSSFFSLPNRANRIQQMLTAKDKLSIADFKEMHLDQHAIMVDDMKPIMINVLEKQKLSELEAAALKKLSNWDHVMSKAGSESLIFEEFYQIFGKNVLKDELGDDLFNKYTFSKYAIDKIFRNKKSILCDDITTKNKIEDFDDMLVKSFIETVASLSNKYGNTIDQWRWGEAHKLVLKHPLGKNKMLDFIFNLNRTYDVGGSFHTVSPYVYPMYKDYTAFHGASQRHIYSIDDWDKSQTIIPTGVSNIPTSKHYCDQSEMFMNGIYHNDFINIEKIKENAVYTAVFSK